MTMKHHRDARAQLIGMLGVAAAGTAAFWIASGAAEAAQTAVLLFGTAFAIHFLRHRSALAETVGGIGDERTQDLNLRARAFAADVLVFVIVGWWLVSVIEGDPNETVSLLGAVFAVAFLGAAFVLNRRR